MNQTSPKELLFVTWNQNKVNEASTYLPGYTINKAWVEVPEIQSVDVTKVIKSKLYSAFQQTWNPCFVMDASLVINWLCNQESDIKTFPWALIKDVFQWMWDLNITRLVNITNDTKCLWTSMLWYYDWSREHYFKESLFGVIASEPRGNNWYDRDTIFMPIWENRTFAEMSPEEKQSYALTSKLYWQFSDFLSKNQ